MTAFVHQLRAAITPLSKRLIAFAGLFILVSGLFGPRIIGSEALHQGGFELYGGIGKAMLFGLIAFVLLVRHSRRSLHVPAVRWPAALGWCLAAGVALGLAWVHSTKLIAGDYSSFNLLMAHGGLVIGVGLLALGCLGLGTVGSAWRVYRREIAATLLITIAFYVFLLAVYAMWRPLAGVVMYSVEALLSLHGLQVTILPPNVLLLDKFGITIAEYCSGVESIALFTSLYALIGLLDRHRLHLKRYLLIFPVALGLLCALNIVRVYFLIASGYYINPQIAFSLFHTYAGLVFFIAYSAAFWLVAYKHLVSKQERLQHEPALQA